MVRTDAGLVRGTTADGLHRFEGIPFATPPVGKLRWQPPAPARTVRTATTEAAAVTSSVGCEDTTCLRKIPAKTLLETFAAQGAAAGPVAGTRELPRQPADAIARGRFHHMPIMHGNTRDEMRLFVGLMYPTELTPTQYAGIVTTMFPDRATEVLAKYPPGDSPRIALAAIQSDHGTGPTSRPTTCSRRRASRSTRTGSPTGRPRPLIVLGPLTPAQEQLSTTMVRDWTTFAHKGRPTHAWPRYHSPADVLNLAPGEVAPVNVAARSNCDFWQS